MSRSILLACAAATLSFQTLHAERHSSEQETLTNEEEHEWLKSVEAEVKTAAEAAKVKSMRDNDVPYRASVLYAAANAAAQFGASMIIERKNDKKKPLTMGATFTGAGWVTPFLEEIAEGDGAPQCLLFVDLGGGSLTGFIYELSGGSYVAPDGPPAEYKSKNNPDVSAFGLDIYGEKNTFKDYSRKEGQELNQWAVILAMHIRKAFRTLQCSGSHADAVWIRQTGKIRHLELVEKTGKMWDVQMRSALKFMMKDQSGKSIPFDYALLPSDKEANYEGINFWTQGNVNTFMGELGTAPSYNKLLLCQVGSSSTQASTCTKCTADTADACTKTDIKAAGAGVLGSLPNEDQDAKNCTANENCFPELYTEMVQLWARAGIKDLGEAPTVAVLNSFGYAANKLFQWCLAEDGDIKNICDATIKKVQEARVVGACCLVKLATAYGGFAAEGSYCTSEQVEACKE
eukprot:TRINITY_DN5478_c0_g1_i1.p1 TRINITY_DN5478_c0_g1~~TRINITY_DN5478_c0_g1_i1.p1  ORF type:complete len:460 (+),score=84.97 TRINITY_DN5478_c0_g1_i1:69-1448(+)